jgi:hypothetical protein
MSLSLPFVVARLFTPKIASYYEGYYNSKGVRFVKGTVLSSFEIDPIGKVNLLPLDNLARTCLNLFHVAEYFRHSIGYCYSFCYADWVHQMILIIFPV